MAKPATVFLGEMTNLEVEAFLAKHHHTVIIPISATEQHGPLGPLATDVLPFMRSFLLSGRGLPICVHSDATINRIPRRNPELSAIGCPDVPFTLVDDSAVAGLS
jgi:Creatinine amidohydrolase